MVKRALVIALGFLSFCFPLAAQQTNRIERSKDAAVTLRQLRPSALDIPARLTLSLPGIFQSDPMGRIHPPTS
jgi:hypothetical protein